jgi:cytochrome c-type biogenesis protein CcmH/NrfG
MPLKLSILALLLLTGSLRSPSQTPAAATGDIQQHMRAAQQHMQEKRPDLAIPEFEAVIATDPNNVDAHANLGVLLYFKGDYTNAVPHLRAAVVAQSSLWKIQALLGLGEMHLKDTANARPDLEAALPHLKGEKVFDEAGEALIASYNSTSEFDKAVRIVAILLEEHPADTRLLMMSYRLYSDLASNAMLTLALVAPHSAEMHQVMARELARHGDEQAAIVNYHEALKANPKLPGLNFELGSLLYDSAEEKLQSEAAEQFQAALAANPNDEKSQFMLGKIAERKGDLKAALAADSRAVQMQPDDSDACTELAKILLATDSADKDQNEKARALLTHAVAIDPLNYTAHYRLVSLDRAEGKTEEAKKELADYQKYKAMKDKLRELFHDMRVRMDDKQEDDDGMEKK